MDDRQDPLIWEVSNFRALQEKMTSKRDCKMFECEDTQVEDEIHRNR